MNEMMFMASLRSLLEQVISGSANYKDLQRFVDKSIIEDEIPSGISEEMRKLIYELQTELELISVSESEKWESRATLDKSEISNRLHEFAIKLSD